jgi:hypothetical protein
MLTRRSLLTYSEESAYGTASAGTYKALEIVRDPDVAPMVVDRLARDTVRPWHGADRQRLVNRRVTVSFSIQLSGSGTAGTAPQFGDFLVSCAMVETVVPTTSVTYALAGLETALKSVTIRWYQDGMLHQVAGARATWTLGANAGEFPTLNIEATGIYSQPTKTALITATFANQAAPIEVSATNTPTVNINSVANCMAAFELNLGNLVEYESYAGCVTQLAIRDRVPEGSIEIQSKVIGSGTGEQNFYSLFEAGTLVPITWTHGITAGNIITLTMSNCQLMEPSLSERGGQQFMSIPFMPITTDGTSEISLAFT